MYRKHFALTQFPFDLTLEPEALFASATLAEAEARLKHLLELGYFRIKVFQLCVLRGTALYRKCKELGLRYQSTPPYSCFQTPLVTMEDSLRIGVLAYILDVVRDIADSVQDQKPFIDYFKRSGDVIDRILERIGKRESSGDIARYLVKDILGVDYLGSFLNAEYKIGADGRPSLQEIYRRSLPEEDGSALNIEEKIRGFLSGLGVKELTIHRQTDALGLQIDREGRRIEIVIFPRRLSRPHFKSTRFYKIAYSGGGRQDIDLVERMVRFILELEGKARSS